MFSNQPKIDNFVRLDFPFWALSILRKQKETDKFLFSVHKELKSKQIFLFKKIFCEFPIVYGVSSNQKKTKTKEVKLSKLSWELRKNKLSAKNG